MQDASPSDSSCHCPISSIDVCFFLCVTLCAKLLTVAWFLALDVRHSMCPSVFSAFEVGEVKKNKVDKRRLEGNESKAEWQSRCKEGKKRDYFPLKWQISIHAHVPSFSPLSSWPSSQIYFSYDLQPKLKVAKEWCRVTCEQIGWSQVSTDTRAVHLGFNLCRFWLVRLS